MSKLTSAEKTEMAASVTFEIEVVVTGTVIPAEPETGPTYDCGGTPGCEASVEDTAVISIGALEWNRVTRKHVFTDLMDGVDLTSPAIIRLFQNILTLKADDVSAAILGDE